MVNDNRTGLTRVGAPSLHRRLHLDWPFTREKKGSFFDCLTQKVNRQLEDSYSSAGIEFLCMNHDDHNK